MLLTNTLTLLMLLGIVDNEYCVCPAVLVKLFLLTCTEPVDPPLPPETVPGTHLFNAPLHTNACPSPGMLVVVSTSASASILAVARLAVPALPV